MLEIIKEETIGEYKYIHYSNGAVVKQNINSENIIEYPEPTPNLPTAQDVINAVNTAKLNEILILLKGVTQ